MSKGFSKEESIKYLNDADEYFFITKEHDVFNSIHSDLSNVLEWIDMIDHFRDKLMGIVADAKKNTSALDDLLNDTDVNLN